MKKWIFAIIIVIVASGIYGAYVYNKAMEKKIPKESKSVEIAKEKAKLTKVNLLIIITENLHIQSCKV